MIVRELAFHKQRLRMAIALDELPNAMYELKFPSPVWEAQASEFIAGAPLRKVEPILNWYDSMAVLGYSIGRLDSPNGLQVVGPDRSHLSTALNEAYMTAMDMSHHWSIGKRARAVLPLFEEANN